MFCVRSDLILFVTLVCLWLHTATCASSGLLLARLGENSFDFNCEDSGLKKPSTFRVYSNYSADPIATRSVSADEVYTVDVTLATEKIVTCEINGSEESYPWELYGELVCKHSS